MVQMYAHIWLLAYLVLTVETFFFNYFVANFVKNLGNGEKHFEHCSHTHTVIVIDMRLTNVENT